MRISELLDRIVFVNIDALFKCKAVDKCEAVECIFPLHPFSYHAYKNLKFDIERHNTDNMYEFALASRGYCKSLTKLVLAAKAQLRRNIMSRFSDIKQYKDEHYLMFYARIVNDLTKRGATTTNHMFEAFFARFCKGGLINIYIPEPAPPALKPEMAGDYFRTIEPQMLRNSLGYAVQGNGGGQSKNPDIAPDAVDALQKKSEPIVNQIAEAPELEQPKSATAPEFATATPIVFAPAKRFTEQPKSATAAGVLNAVQPGNTLSEQQYNTNDAEKKLTANVSNLLLSATILKANGIVNKYVYDYGIGGVALVAGFALDFNGNGQYLALLRQLLAMLKFLQIFIEGFFNNNNWLFGVAQFLTPFLPPGMELKLNRKNAMNCFYYCMHVYLSKDQFSSTTLDTTNPVISTIATGLSLITSNNYLESWIEKPASEHTYTTIIVSFVTTSALLILFLRAVWDLIMFFCNLCSGNKANAEKSEASTSLVDQKLNLEKMKASTGTTFESMARDGAGIAFFFYCTRWIGCVEMQISDYANKLNRHTEGSNVFFELLASMLVLKIGTMTRRFKQNVLTNTLKEPDKPWPIATYGILVVAVVASVAANFGYISGQTNDLIKFKTSRTNETATNVVIYNGSEAVNYMSSYLVGTDLYSSQIKIATNGYANLQASFNGIIDIVNIAAFSGISLIHTARNFTDNLDLYPYMQKTPSDYTMKPFINRIDSVCEKHIKTKEFAFDALNPGQRSDNPDVLMGRLSKIYKNVTTDKTMYRDYIPEQAIANIVSHLNMNGNNSTDSELRRYLARPNFFRHSDDNITEIVQETFVGHICDFVSSTKNIELENTKKTEIRYRLMLNLMKFIEVSVPLANLQIAFHTDGRAYDNFLNNDTRSLVNNTKLDIYTIGKHLIDIERDYKQRYSIRKLDTDGITKTKKGNTANCLFRVYHDGISVNQGLNVLLKGAINSISTALSFTTDVLYGIDIKNLMDMHPLIHAWAATQTAETVKNFIKTIQHYFVYTIATGVSVCGYFRSRDSFLFMVTLIIASLRHLNIGMEVYAAQQQPR